MVGHRSAPLLRRALTSLFRECRTNYELVLLVNGNDFAVTELAEEFLQSEKRPMLLLKSSEVRPGFARTLALPHTRGEVVLFLDDDVELFSDVVSRVETLFEDSELDVAGGANLTPTDSKALERASGAALGSFWGTMSMRFRYQQGKTMGECTEHSLILCNLAVRRSVLLGSGGFPHSVLVSNEENVLLQRLGHAGKKMIADPQLAVFHRRRGSWRGVAQQSLKYGQGRGQNVLLLPETLKVIYFLPSILLLSLLWSVFPFLLYFAVGILFSLAHFVRTRDFAAFTLQPFLYPVMHFSYGFGFLLAFVQWSWRREVLCSVSE
jgi:cellulose synthase/poly-beta-1,6-N-acetylglucosamine synthase-like glycosyltransferase